MSKFKCKTSVYKNHPIISIFEFCDKGFQKFNKAKITFGIGKAKAILDQLDEIRAFVESNMPKDEIDEMIEKILIEGEEDGSL
jgi:hypothetical protein